MKRHEDALAISSGACNISGIARTLVQACDEARAYPIHGYGTGDDPAVQLIISQLAYLAGIWDGASEWAKSDFGSATDACHEAIEIKGFNHES